MVMRGFVPILFVMACSATPAPQPGPRPLDASACDAACAHLRDLSCEEGLVLQDGTTCEAFCHDTASAGHNLNPDCLLTIKACSEIDSKCTEQAR
jgi:hypothetical protein